jgi:hypothetical protein
MFVFGDYVVDCILIGLVNFNRHDRSKAVDILVKDLKVFATFNEELFKEITQLLTLENFRYEKFVFMLST